MPSEHGLPLVSGGGVLSARPEVAVETGCRHEKRLAEVKVQLLRLPSLGLVIDPELPDPGLECENRSRGKPRYHYGNRQPSGRVTSPLSLSRLGAASEGGSWGVLEEGAPRLLQCGGCSAPISGRALFFCSGLGGRPRAGPRPVCPPSSFSAPQQVCLFEPAGV